MGNSRKIILAVNVGSTSYKYALFGISDVDSARLKKGSFERVSNYEEAISGSLAELKEEGFGEGEIDAVVFKTVLGKNISGLLEADERVVEALEAMSFVAPAHNPPYAAAIRAFGKILPSAKKFALFETSFYDWADDAWKRYAVPNSWFEIGIKRNGFHGATHKYAAERVAELCGRPDAAESAKMLYVNKGRLPLEKPFRMTNCHLGGSSSVCGVLNGAAIGTSMGFSPQSGLPQNNRVGDLDAAAIPFAMREFGISADEALAKLSKEGGLLGISGVSNDMRDIRGEAMRGNPNARLAIDTLAHSARSYIGAWLAQMGGLDAISFSGGIGENDFELREEILEPLENLGVSLDKKKNESLPKKSEGIISSDDSKIKVAVVVSDEELVMAREAARMLSAR